MSTNHPDKGKQNGRCNVTSCQAPGATWFNHSTRAWYCRPCAMAINRVNRVDAMRFYGHELCLPLLKEPA